MEQQLGGARFGVLLQSNEVELWQLKALKYLVADGHKAVVFIYPEKEKSSSKVSFFDKLKTYPFKNILFRLYWRYVFKCSSKQIVNLKESLSSEHTIHANIKHKGFSSYYDDKSIEELKSFNLDFLVRMNQGILRGAILKVAKHGIWSYHHGDEQGYRGGPPGFWEIVRKEYRTGAMLQQLTSTLDGGLIITKGYFSTIHHSYDDQLNQLLDESAVWLSDAANKLVQGKLTKDASSPTPPIRKVPTNTQLLKFLFRVMNNRVALHIKHFFKHEKWNIAISNNAFTAKSLTHFENEVFWLPEKKGFYFADPFCVETKTEKWLFFELFDYKKGKASLAVSRSFSNTHLDYTELWNKDTHASFPFLLKHENTLYCLPENHESNGVDLYAFDEEKVELKFVKRILDDLKVVDPCLHQQGDLWYLFFTTKQQSSTALYSAVSNNGLLGEYNLTSNYPIKYNIGNARMAGSFFKLDGKLIRPAQNCIHTYGASVKLMEVTDVDDYAEQEYFSLKPISFSNYNCGLHTLSVDGQCYAIDGKRYTFSFSYFCFLLKSKLGLNV